MDAARKFVDKGQIDKAVKEYLRIVHEDPKDVRVWLKIGDLYAKKGAKQDAIETYLKVARFYQDQGFFLKAVAVYKQILKIDPRLVDVILKLAELYRQLGLMSDAMQHFESVAAHFHREGNTKEALATVQKLVDLDPENIATRIKLAELYSKENLIEDAAKEFAVACDQLRRQNRQDDFLKVAERLLWHKPDNQPLNRELAGLYLRRNDPRRALQKLQACFKADPRDVETLGLLAQAFQALDQKAKTVSVLKELARIHTENHHKAHAGDVFRKILELVPNDADALAFLGTPPPAPVARPSSQGIAHPPPPPPPSSSAQPMYAGGPPPPMPAVPPPPYLRQSTPMPAQIRAATADARFRLTDDLPYAPASARMTGSMPLIDEAALQSAEFQLPEDEDPDFWPAMEPPDARAMSAAGEQHAEEISKILAETDVYVKYGLHQKAIDHLRRVFTLDGDNVEAHERLKDIFLSQGREAEAEAELLRLAEVVAPIDPDRAELYLQELLTLSGTHTGAFDLARRFRLRVARMASSVTPHGSHHDPDPIDDFDPDELIGNPLAHGSPAPARPPQRPHDDFNDPDAFDIDFEPSPSQATRQLSPEAVEALVARQQEVMSHHAHLDETRAGRPSASQSNRWAQQRAQARAIDAELDDAELGDDIDRQVASELGHATGEDLPFDRDEARAFDAGVPRTAAPIGAPIVHTDVAYGGDDFDKDDDAQHTGGYDPYGTEAIQTPASFADPTASHVVASYEPGAAEPTRAESRIEIENELEDAEFYIGQHMYAEAADVLNALLARFPGHRLVLAKLRDLDAMTGHATSVGHDPISAGSATDAINIDDIEEVGVDDLVELDNESRPVPHAKRQPTVMLEKPLDESDAATHYDLGLAYKEMALLDDAIKAFEKALRAPGREIQCRVMIGMCLREMGNPSEAIHQFKQGLHAEPTELERQSLYYEIGVTYEAIGDDSEALYFFEMVVKRNASFADAARRAERLRSRGGRAMHAHDDDI
ncbi:MAG TPA: tetratricopeptide repeat protein [Kofleriaceae bacterium]|nr:tetratricopeptide repeat protein [Kofleriaceae bacterium]